MTTAVADLDLTNDNLFGPYTPPSYPESPFEFHCGMPSRPICIYHTGDPWPRPRGYEAYPVPKEAIPIFTHPIAPVWRELGRRIHEYFDSIYLKWTSIDFVRFSEVGKRIGPPFVWVGVLPKTLSREDAKNAAVRCKLMLAESHITNVEIAFRESVFTRSAGPQLLSNTHIIPPSPFADIRHPFTPALGVSIAPKSFSHFEGTGGLYIREGGESNRVFLLTTRHVVLPPSEYRNELYERKDNSSPCRDVILLGAQAFQKALESVTRRIEHETFRIEDFKYCLKVLGEAVQGEDAIISEQREQYNEEMIVKTQELIGTLDKFYTEITKFWAREDDRMLGHVVYAPPISGGTGDKCFAEDWALVELRSEKINWDSFKGNSIYLRILSYDYKVKMYPDCDILSGKYPVQCLLKLQDVVGEDELRHPTVLDKRRLESFFVLKDGTATGFTIGRASGFESFVREYDNNVIRSTSMMMAIHPYCQEDGKFSAPGDSGSVVADRDGRIVGILTGGAGNEGNYDVSYATPYYWLEERIKAAFPDSHLY